MRGIPSNVGVSTPNLHDHDFSHEVNTSMDFFQFRPVLCMEMYPKDYYNVNIADYFRAKPMAGACFGRFHKKYSAFFVPYRILWKNWNNFLTGGSNGRLTPEMPHYSLHMIFKAACNLYEKIKDGTLSGNDLNHAKAVYRNMIDFWLDLGIPADLIWEFDNVDLEDYYDTLNPASQLYGERFKIPILRFAACRQIWFDWYRDQNLIGDDARASYIPQLNDGYRNVDVLVEQLLSPTFEGPSTYHLMPPVGVEKDYFTTAMAEPQRGVAAFVPVQLVSGDINEGFASDPNQSEVPIYASWDNDGKPSVFAENNGDYGSNIIGQFDYNAVRIAKGYQKFLEKNNIAGGSDLQQLLAHWGVAPTPEVFNRSVYIGSFDDEIQLSEVVSPSDTYGTEYGSEAGQVATRLNGSGKGNFSYTAKEHGFFIVICTLRPENTYVSTLAREVLHGCLGNGRFDFFTPELEKTGFQPMYGYEKTFKACSHNVHYSGLTRDTAVGYVPRYAECKRMYNRYTGQLALAMNSQLRITRDTGYDTWDLTLQELFINTGYTMVYGYPYDLQYDHFFSVPDPQIDHFEGWIKFFIDAKSERSPYSAPLIQDAKGNDIVLPYAGVRM